MVNLLEYLKGPELVVKIQEFFGIQYLNKQKNINGILYKLYKNNDNNDLLSCQKNPSQSQQQHQYIITNKFWYYLFIIGTEFGDELFYATMIPFWFWNIDGAVGRRVVFIWSMVMYVGKMTNIIEIL